MSDCLACERIRQVCDRAEAQIREETKIKQAGHINTLAIRCAMAGEMDPWESEELKNCLQMLKTIEKAADDGKLSDADFRAFTRETIV